MPINLGSAYGEIQIGTGEAESNVASLASTMRSIGTTMSLGITAPLAGIGVTALSAAADFEQSMNTIGVVSGATTDQLADLQAQALQLGAETSFSAGEAAEAMLELAKAGFSVEQTQAAVAGVLDLAAAGGLGLASAAEIAANAVNAFGLSAEDSGRVANMLAAAANASSVDVKDLADSMKMSSAVMSSYGQSIDDTTTALALLGNAGLKGSDAGTSLKQMMLSLAAPTDKAAKLMADLGVEVYDAQGNMREFPDILRSLEQAMFGVSQATVVTGGRTAEQTAELKRLQAMAKRTQASINDYTAGVKGAGLSEEARKKKLAALNSELAQQQAAIAALMGIQGQATTVTRQLTEEERNAALATIFGSDAVRAANILLGAGEDAWNDMAKAVTKEGAASEVAAARMKGLGGAIEYFKGSIESLLIETFLPFLDSLSAAIRWIADLASAFNELDPSIKQAAIAFLAVLAAAGPVMLAITGIGALLGALLSPIGLVVLAIAGLAAAWAGDWFGIREAVMPVVDDITAKLDELTTRATAAFNLVGGGINGMVAALGSVTGGAVIFDAEAQVTNVYWGTFTYTYDAISQITKVTWNDPSLGLGTFSYDAEAGIVKIDWTGQTGAANLAFSYDSSAGIKYVEWNEDIFKFVYDAEAKVTEVEFFGGLYYGKYDAIASVTEVLWGTYQHFYSTEAVITRVAWGAYTHLYDAQAQIQETSVLWGLWTNVYDVGAKVAEANLLWGLWTYTYDVGAEVKSGSIVWGLWSHSYDAQAKVAETSVLWGLWSHSYDVEAGVTEFKIMGMSVTEFAKWFHSKLAIASPLAALGLEGGGKLDFEWPALPTMTWPKYPDWTWPEYLSFEWPEYTAWEWPTLPEFEWPTLPKWTWPPYLKWEWPTLPTWEWPPYLDWIWKPYPTWTWPKIPTPDWLDRLLNWRPSLPGWLGGNDATGSAVVPSAVEPVQPASRSLAGAGGGNTYLTVEVGSINSALDLEHVAAVIASKIRYRQH